MSTHNLNSIYVGKSCSSVKIFELLHTWFGIVNFIIDTNIGFSYAYKRIYVINAWEFYRTCIIKYNVQIVLSSVMWMYYNKYYMYYVYYQVHFWDGKTLRKISEQSVVSFTARCHTWQRLSRVTQTASLFCIVTFTQSCQRSFLKNVQSAITATTSSCRQQIKNNKTPVGLAERIK